MPQLLTFLLINTMSQNFAFISPMVWMKSCCSLQETFLKNIKKLCKLHVK